jgi:hypothetical protein
MDLSKKREKFMEKMGQMLCRKPSAKQIRKQKRKLQHLRSAARERWAEQEALLDEQIERDKVVREFLASEDMDMGEQGR